MHAFGGVGGAALHHAQPAVDGLDDRAHPVRLEEGRGIPQVLDVNLLGLRQIGARPDHARHDMHHVAVQPLRVLDHARKRCAKLRFTSGNGGKPAVARAPVAHRSVEQHHLQAMRTEPGAQLGRRILVRDLELHGAEAAARGSLEALEEGDFSEQVVQVGRESRHCQVRCVGSDALAESHPDSIFLLEGFRRRTSWSAHARREDAMVPASSRCRLPETAAMVAAARISSTNADGPGVEVRTGTAAAARRCTWCWPADRTRTACRPGSRSPDRTHRGCSRPGKRSAQSGAGSGSPPGRTRSRRRPARGWFWS